MSSGTLRHWVLSTTKDCSRAAAFKLASPRGTSPSPGSTLAPWASSKRQSGTNTLQIRYFHPTPARRLFESSEAIVAGCLGVAGGVLLTRFLLGKSLVIPRRATSRYLPPRSWWVATDENTRKDVREIISAGFEMASKAPKPRRDKAYREATFQVPHEIARLNPDAPRFKVEEMAPLSSLRDVWPTVANQGVQMITTFDKERDARVFLYFPNGSAKATAAFIAINAEYTPGHQNVRRMPGGYRASTDQFRLLMSAMNIWMCQNVHWAHHHQDILHRIGPLQLPVIINFRGSVVGGVWDSETALFPQLSQFESVLHLMAEDG